MKKVFLFITALFFIEMTIAQIGSWPAPPNQVNFTSAFPYASIIPNGFNFSYSGSEGAYNDNGDLLFYTVKASGGGRAIYEPGNNNQVGWLSSIGSYNIESEQCIITPVPGQTQKYYVIYTLMYPPAEAYLAYSIIDCNNATVSIEANSTAVGQSIGGAFLGLVLSEINNSKYIYVTGGSALLKYQINQNGVSFVGTVADMNTCPLDIYDFETNFLDVSLDGSKLAWIKMNVPPDEIVVMELDQNGNYLSLQQYPLNPNAYGYIRGIQFTTEPGYDKLYFTGSDNAAFGGVFSLDLNTGSVSTMNFTNEFGMTWLQTGSDGFIYAVANDGSHLGRINTLTNTFENNVLNITVNSNGDVTFYEWGNIYHLASNSNYKEFLVTGDKTDVTCSGYNDGTAIANAEGGVEPYSYLWDDPDAQTTATATGLSPGTYTCQVTDAGGRVEYVSVTVLTDPTLFNYTGPFTINSAVEWNQVDYKIDHDIIIGSGGSLVIKNNSNVEFDYLAGFIVQNGGELFIQDNASLSGIAACGYTDWNGIQVHDLGYCEISTMSMRDCISNVHEDGTLHVTENGMLTLQANTQLVVESFGYLCFDETATLNLVASNSVLNLETDYNMGVNPDLSITPAPDCVDICTLNQIGQGYINMDENYDFHYEVTIDSDETWTNEVYRFKYNLIIEDGATLNLVNSGDALKNVQSSKSIIKTIYTGRSLIF